MQKKLTRVRSPRLQTSYDLQIGDAIELNELPFLPGLPGDLAHQATAPLFRLNDCRFIDVNVHNFDSVLRSLNACLVFSGRSIEHDGSGDLLTSLNLQIPKTPNDDGSENQES